jgi:hypothetical protein
MPPLISNAKTSNSTLFEHSLHLSFVQNEAPDFVRGRRLLSGMKEVCATTNDSMQIQKPDVLTDQAFVKYLYCMIAVRSNTRDQASYK